MPDLKKRILIVAGEASADRYGARLVKKLLSVHSQDTISFYGTGGDEMQRAGVDLLCHIRELAHIGVREAFSSIRTYYQVFNLILRHSVEQPPRVAILLDFPEFNLRLAKKMKRLGVKVIYYISPQVWAWRSGRVRVVREYVDKMLVILPFEEDYYRERGVEVEFVGHPLLEDFAPERNREGFLRRLNLDPKRKTLAILPGSRRKEIDYILPTLLQATQQVLQEMPAQVLISAAPTIEPDHITNVTWNVLKGDSNSACFRIVTENSRDILANADFAFVKSGTSTLEAALAGTPFLITYKISPFSWYLGAILIRSSMKGLVNLIAKEEIVPEFLQSAAKPQALAKMALQYLQKPEKAAVTRLQLAKIREQLSTRCASETVTAIVNSYL